MDLGQDVSPNGVVTKRGRGRPKQVQPAPARFRLEHIPAAGPEGYKLKTVWEFVKAGCEQVLEKAHGYYSWCAEDVYLALRLNKATLYMAHLDGELKGFGIVQTNQDVFGNTPPYLLSWVGYCASRECRIAYFAELETVAKSFKLREIRHTSTRKGWLVDPPSGPDGGWETLTSRGWIEKLTREQIHQLLLTPEITQRKIVK